MIRAIAAMAALCLPAAVAFAGESPTAFMVAQGAPLVENAFINKNVVSRQNINTVRASWYGGGEYLNARTATGERFNPSGHTAAHRSLPFGTLIEVTNLATHLSTIVRINDRGPARWTGRDLDLARAAAASIGMIGAGLARVTYRVVH